MDIEDYISNYGPQWRRSIAIDHVWRAEALGGVIRVPQHGLCQYLVLPGGEAVPIVCHAWVHELDELEWANYERVLG